MKDNTMPSYHLQIFLAGIPNERCLDSVLEFPSDRAAEKAFDKEWDTYGSPRRMGTLTRIMADGDLKHVIQFGPFSL